MNYYIVTFGCQANKADSERIAAMLESRGMRPAKTIDTADHIVINTCMIRESAENRVYGLVNNLVKIKNQKLKIKSANKNSKILIPKIVVTGCMVGMAVRDKTGKFLKKIREAMPKVDEFLPIEEVGFDHAPLRTGKNHAWVPISNGCNNFCTFCVVPFTRGREVSRPFDEVINEVEHLVSLKYTEITLLGQNVNSYGADLIVGKENVQVMRDLPVGNYFQKFKTPACAGRGYGGQVNFKTTSENIKLEYRGKNIKPTYVKHLGRLRIPTLFPFLLKELCKIKGLAKIDFISSNPWDFSDELIEVICDHPQISRQIHLPIQSGDDQVLKRMNRWYTSKEYLELVANLKLKIKNLELSTDIIVGFPGETKKQFENTVNLCKQVGFAKAYIAMYSDRPITAAHKVYQDDVPYAEKKRRWRVLEEMINRRSSKLKI